MSIHFRIIIETRAWRPLHMSHIIFRTPEIRHLVTSSRHFSVWNTFSYVYDHYGIKYHTEKIFTWISHYLTPKSCFSHRQCKSEMKSQLSKSWKVNKCIILTRYDELSSTWTFSQLLKSESQKHTATQRAQIVFGR